MKRALLVLFGFVLIGVVTAMAAMLYRSRRARSAPPIPAAPGVGSAAQTGERITVEVLNATPQHGLARRVTFFLRDQGFDVVAMGNAGAGADNTIVLDRSHHPAWAKRVAHALGGVPVIERPDSSRYLDVTVLLGRAWRPPAEAFHP